MLGFAILGICFSLTLAWLWAGGIDYMARHHSDYGGEDFLN